MRVSILICTYGSQEWADLAARRALPSASNQGAHEVLVRHHVDGGLAEVRNEAALRATGEWLCFLDADDELGNGYVWAMVRSRLTEEAVLREGLGLNSILVPAVQYVEILREQEIAAGETGLITRSEAPVVLNDGRPLYEINRAVIGSLVPRELFLHLGGFNAALSSLEDWELWLRCERAGAELVDVPDAVYRAYHRRAQRSRNSDQRLYHEIRSRYERGAA